MLLLRKKFVEKDYEHLKKILFHADPEDAHAIFKEFSKFAIEQHPLLTRMMLNYSWGRHNKNVIISPAAGFNKDGDIHPLFLKYLGFDRNVVGTVTAQPWDGNPRPRIERKIKEGGLLNWMGLPGIGARGVRMRLDKYEQVLPLTINIMATPGAQDKLQDLETTLFIMEGVGDRVELNISCPNTCHAREGLQKELAQMLGVVVPNLFGKELYVKFSPDSSMDAIQDSLDVCCDFVDVRGFVVGNTTTQHKFRDGEQFKGGGSGKLVYPVSKKAVFGVCDMIARDYSSKGWKVIACGGIDCNYKVKEYQALGIKEFQVFTPFIYGGPELLRELKE